MTEHKKSAENNADAIADYYNNNTRLFLGLGGSGDVAAIHRAIWAPGVTDKAQAFNFLNVCVANALQPCVHLSDGSQPQLLDLGCGVGGTSTWLAQALAVNVTGITISSEQQKLATQRAKRLGLENQVRFVQGDFAAMPELDASDAAFAIESFVHASDAEDFFSMAARFVKPGGRLVICDDFLSPQISAREKTAADAWIRRFQRGWHLNNLVTADQAVAAASQQGFDLLESHDLSAHTRSFHPLLLLIVSQVTRIPLPWSYWNNLGGGTALQICLLKSWTHYRVLVWQRRK
jgi:ubiquinone/menaquinone biosynthesis C-methylase UbiE